MTDLKIQPYGTAGDWDLVIADNDFALVGDTEDTWPDELRQRVVYAVGTWFQESAFDRGVGFPWVEGVFGKQPIEGIAELIYNHISRVDGVEEIEDPPRLELDTATRKLSITVGVKGRGFSVPVTTTIEGAQ